MDKVDVPRLSTRLGELADALQGRAPSSAGLTVWLDALREFKFDAVLGALSSWSVAHVKMPAPADIVKVCRDSASARLERDAARQRDAGGFSMPNPNSPVAKRELAKIKDALSDCHGKLIAGHFRHISGRDADPKEWARVLQVREAAGEVLSLTQLVIWREALGVDRLAAAE